MEMEIPRNVVNNNVVIRYNWDNNGIILSINGNIMG